jgi:hypothetical protein
MYGSYCFRAYDKLHRIKSGEGLRRIGRTLEDSLGLRRPWLRAACYLVNSERKFEQYIGHLASSLVPTFESESERSKLFLYLREYKWRHIVLLGHPFDTRTKGIDQMEPPIATFESTTHAGLQWTSVPLGELGGIAPAQMVVEFLLHGSPVKVNALIRSD